MKTRTSMCCDSKTVANFIKRLGGITYNVYDCPLTLPKNIYFFINRSDILCIYQFFFVSRVLYPLHHNVKYIICFKLSTVLNFVGEGNYPNLTGACMNYFVYICKRLFLSEASHFQLNAFSFSVVTNSNISCP